MPRQESLTSAKIDPSVLAELSRTEGILKRASRMAHFGVWNLEITDKNDLNSCPLTWSEEAYRVFGYEPYSVPVTNDLFFSAVHPDDRQKIVDKVAQAIRLKEPYIIEHRVIRPDKTERVVLEYAEITFDGDDPVRISGAVQDITERKQLESRLREAVRMRDEFLSIASHELKTPITSLRLQYELMLRLIRSESDPLAAVKKVSEKLDKFVKQIDRLTNIIEDLLDISRINVGKFSVEMHSADLSKFLLDVLSRYQEQFDKAGVSLRAEIEPGVRTSFDSNRMEQLTTNLLSNAIKYGKSDRPVEVTFKRKTKIMAELRVQDYGIGISPEDKNRIFRRFERVASSTNVGGFGLGLYIVKQIVDLHGGTIDVQSTLGEGASFTVQLPLRG